LHRRQERDGEGERGENWSLFRRGGVMILLGGTIL
jgi:hypothetical protein